jgi:hypothetical protein
VSDEHDEHRTEVQPTAGMAEAADWMDAAEGMDTRSNVAGSARGLATMDRRRRTSI